MRVKPLKLSLAAILGVALIAPLSAQDDDVIEEVFVTATKRQQTLQEVPVAVSVTGSEVIEKAQITDILDLQSVVPSLRVTQLQSSANTNFLIRGFGNGANNAGIEPSVGVFIDGVYRSRSGSAISDLPNLQRVEVLRGPQSTLFGKNASAGVISVVTAKPGQELGGYGELTLGNFGLTTAKGFVEGGITDTLAASAGVTVNQRDGYFKNLAGGSDSNERDRWGFRGQVLYTPTDNSEFRLILDQDEIDEVCCGAGNIISNPALNPLLNVLADGNPATPSFVADNPFAYENFYNSDSSNFVENKGVSLQADVNFSNFDLTSITSRRKGILKTGMDSDFSAADIIGANDLDLDIDTITQELRITSTGDGRVDWLAGAFYLDEEVYLESGIYFGDAFRSYADALTGGGVTQLEQLLALPAGTFHRSGDGVLDKAGQENQSLSFYGQFDFHFSDSWTGTVGLNHTNDEKDVRLSQVNNDPFSQLELDGAAGFQALVTAGIAGAFPTVFPGLSFPNDLPTVLGDPTLAAIFAGLQAQVTAGVSALDLSDPAQNPLLGLQAVQFLPPILGFPNAVENGKTDDSDTTYTLRLAWDVNDSLNLYASKSTGFKATSWNLSRDSRPFVSDIGVLAGAGLTQPNQTTGTRFAGPERATVLEVGAKARLERGAVNVTVFDQEIKGFQSNIFTGTGFSLANAGKQSTWGIELDLTYDLTDDLTWTFASTYLDPTYDSFVGARTLNGVEDLSGTTPAGIHEISATTSLTYNWGFSNGWDAYVRGDYLYESNVRANENTPASIMRQINTLNGSFGVTTTNDWNIALWGRNLTDDQYLLSSFPTVIQGGSFSGYPSQPRTYGLTVRKSF